MDEDLRVLANRAYEAVNHHDMSEVDDDVAPNFEEHEALPNGGRDWDSVKKTFDMYFEAFPDLRVEIDDMAVAGNKVWTRGRFCGTNTGSLMGIPPTDKYMEVEFMDCLCYENGKCTEHWGLTDQVKLLQELGVMPEGVPA